jgi:hypothetical protein
MWMQYGEWELRFGPENRFRIIYRFSVPERMVYIGAIGEKPGRKQGGSTAVLLAISDDELEDFLTSRSPEMRAVLDKAWADIASGEGIPHEEFWQRFAPED